MYVEFYQRGGDSSDPYDLPANRKLLIAHIYHVTIHFDRSFPAPALNLSQYDYVMAAANDA